MVLVRKAEGKSLQVKSSQHNCGSVIFMRSWQCRVARLNNVTWFYAGSGVDEVGHSGARGIALDVLLEFGGEGSSRTLQLTPDLASWSEKHSAMCSS